MPVESQYKKSLQSSFRRRISYLFSIPIQIMATIARIYQAQFDRAPTKTLMITNGALAALGDICAQSMELFVSALLFVIFSDFLTGLCCRDPITLIANTMIPLGRSVLLSSASAWVSLGIGNAVTQYIEPQCRSSYRPLEQVPRTRVSAPVGRRESQFSLAGKTSGSGSNHHVCDFCHPRFSCRTLYLTWLPSSPPQGSRGGKRAVSRIFDDVSRNEGALTLLLSSDGSFRLLNGLHGGSDVASDWRKVQYVLLEL